MLHLLHLCDTLFPLGGFAYSDGLESATARDAIADADGLREWIDVCLDETIGRTEGRAAWQAWAAVRDERWDALAALDRDLVALRPSSSARRSTRAMGSRLLTTWNALYPDPRLTVLQRVTPQGPALPIAFAAVCVCIGVDRQAAVEAFAYTRLAATISASMRLMPIGQTEAHALLARSLARVPRVIADLAATDAPPESFAPALDIAAMTQQYLHSRLFRS